jgi:Uma2 family endonuclease
MRDTVGMASATSVPVSEYLGPRYRPDCEYVDGELQERNAGERPHNAVQFILARIFNSHLKDWKIVAFPEQRVNAGANRYRIPDVCVLRRSDTADDIVQKAPLICIEVLSPEDRSSRMMERFADYAQMGVEHLWMIDPMTRYAWTISADGSQQRVHGAFTVTGTPIRIELAEVFAELDDMQSPG